MPFSDSIVNQLRAILDDRADIELALLFGFVARGDSDEGSDIDIAVATGLDHGALAAELSLAMGCE